MKKIFLKILAFALLSSPLCAQPFTFHDQAFLRALTRTAGGGGGGTPFDWITTYTPSANLFNFNWCIGCQFTVGAVNLNVTAIRWFNVTNGTPNTGTHQVGIWNNTGTLLASTTVALTGVGDHTWVSSAIGPLTLTAGATYTIAALTGSDYWAYQDATIATTGDATIITAVFDASGTFVLPTNAGTASHEYIGLDLVGTK